MSVKEIKIDCLARVEGETAITVRLKGRRAEEIKLKIFEPPRFFEGFLVGRGYDEVGDIVSRICGICPVSHMTTAIQAVENAIGFVPTARTRKLRRLMSLSQIAASHAVHLYMLAMPDYFGYQGTTQMLIRKFKPEIARFMRMKDVFNSVTAAIGGRALHPVTSVVGGFTAVPGRRVLMKLKDNLEKIRPDAEGLVRFVAGFPFPDFESGQEYVALKNENEYAVNHGRIVSNRGLDLELSGYRGNFVEREVPYAMAKRSTIGPRGTFMTGALARLNIKFDQLADETKRLAGEIGFHVPDYNPFHNIIAQALEVFDFTDECITLLEDLELNEEYPAVKPGEGEGESMTEAPRGLLYHHYIINRRGMVEKADIITPTSHNFGNIEKDIRLLAEKMARSSTDKIRFACEQLVRAYDPCFSCSVH